MKKWKLGFAIHYNNALAVFDEDAKDDGQIVNAICLISPIDKVCDEDKKNAMLIAALPDVYNAAKRIIELHKRVDWLDTTLIDEEIVAMNELKLAILKSESEFKVVDESKDI